mmetsp:Transcript_22362/g.43515  ORF Transcript_22362/g.43515 Transcript_22362/m.43515 type:complete len:93 (+) Transcript_22362:3-281(+)
MMMMIMVMMIMMMAERRLKEQRYSRISSFSGKEKAEYTRNISLSVCSCLLYHYCESCSPALARTYPMTHPASAARQPVTIIDNPAYHQGDPT